MTDSFSVRAARRGDATAVVALARDLLRHLGDPTDSFDSEQFIEDAFGAQRQFELVVAEDEGIVVGYALFHDAYEPAFTARGTYLSDLFVAAGSRRRGVGRALMAAVARATKERGRTFVWWVARGDDARAFYRSLGAEGTDCSAHALTFAHFETLACE